MALHRTPRWGWNGGVGLGAECRRGVGTTGGRGEGDRRSPLPGGRMEMVCVGERLVGIYVLFD
jgi:hypothetical protein